ncbi:DUF1566 domain-containing protein [bacterium]|nr:DUF1566 domain-containing protein [bacterium]
MRRNILISLLIALAVLVSCEEKEMKWINAQDPHADSAAITEICEKNNAECGYIKAKADDGKFHKFFCGGCENGYRCGGNKCQDIDECANSSLNNCNYEVSTCANEEGSYSCICKENYSGDDCVPNTRTKECSSLPENAEWNTASSITQTWNGSEWEPANAGIYGETASTNECIFKCKENYNWDLGFSVCEAATRTAECTGLPENAEWNGTLSLMQAWNGDEWTPSSEATFSKTPGECTFKCSTGFYWNESKCEVAPTQTVDCAGLPENAHWNSSSTIIQTWDGDEWLPNNIGVYGENEGENECKFKCNSNYFWNDSQCVNPCDSNPCNSISNSTGICSPSSWEKYSCGCETNYTWNGYTCTSPCNSHPCSNIENSTGVCILTSKDSYKCECKETYLWRNSKCNKITIGNICTGQDKCYNERKEIVCPDLHDDFFGQDAQYAALGTCIPHNFEIKTYAEGEKTVIDKNTGLEWQQEITNYAYDLIYNSGANGSSYCNNLRLGNHDDWRFPTVNELFSIIDSGKYGPALDTTYFSNIPTDESSYFWTSQKINYAGGTYPYYDNYDGTWVVSIYNGKSYYRLNSNASYIICVRGDENIFQDAQLTTETVNGDEVIIDSVSGLVWQKNYPNNGKEWGDALAYCEKSTYAGYSDWKLPNKNELASLIKYPSYHTDSYTTDFPNIDFTSSSTNSNDNKNQYFTYVRGYGLYIDSNEKYNAVNRCVRHGFCDEGFTWNGVGCVKCDPTPCLNVEHATGECALSAWNEFSCKCERHHTWNGSKCDLLECDSLNGAPCKDSSTNLMWSTRNNAMMDWDSAIDYCSNLNEEGYNDWHLPTIDELRTLIQNCPNTETGGSCKVTNNCLSSSCRNDDYCNGCGIHNDGSLSKFGNSDFPSYNDPWFWSSSVKSDNTNSAWIILFSHANISSSNKTGTKYVRCVR